ncbi:Protoheme IX farnesyltransferase, mitochondrial [Microbotryomycetes sp. JL201]|nr:Protoheme IX farnesyltransferase, mitochondrial [Microbotryomycetes sp. JL201]
MSGTRVAPTFCCICRHARDARPLAAAAKQANESRSLSTASLTATALEQSKRNIKQVSLPSILRYPRPPECLDPKARGSEDFSSEPKVYHYAHEDLLSRAPEDSRSSMSKAGFFSKSRGTASPALAAASQAPPSTSPLVPVFTPIPAPLPSPVLSNGMPNPEIRWRPKPDSTLAHDLAQYQALGKFRLTVLVVLTAMSGYAMCPVDPTSTQAAMDVLAQTISTLPSGTSLEALAVTAPSTPSSPANNLALSVLLPATVGTGLCSASAATFNEIIEAPYDAQMARTRGRPLPRRYVSPLQAATFGALTGSIGVATLYAINPLCAGIGLGTILLYCPVYTIMKRHTIWNTWLGAVVGALPPMIGWAACTDSLSPMTQPGAYALFALLFFWQFPHFMALAHTVRSSYASSGYHMLAAVDPRKNALVALRYTLAMIPLCLSFPYLGLTNAIFPFLSLVPNGLMTVAAWKFWTHRSDRTAKVLFWASLVQLPVVLIMAMLCKNGLWGSDELAEDEALAVGADAGKETPSSQSVSTSENGRLSTADTASKLV